MGQEHMANRIDVLKIEVTNTSTGVDQHIVVDQHRGSSCASTNSATTSEYANSHQEGSLKHVLVG